MGERTERRSDKEERKERTAELLWESLLVLAVLLVLEVEEEEEEDECIRDQTAFINLCGYGNM